MAVDTLSDEQSEVLEWLNIVISLLSIGGSSFVIVCYLLYRDLRSFAFYLVCMVAVSDFFFSIGLFFGDAGGSKDTHLGASMGLCMVQSLFISYFELTSLFWSVSIAYTLFEGFIKENPEFRPDSIAQYKCRFLAVCWGLPVILTVLPFTTDSYGDTGGWCWIKSETPIDSMWRFLQYYIWIWLAVAFNSFVFYNIHRKIKAIEASVGEPPQSNKMAKRLKLYPMILVAANTFAFIAAIVEAGGTIVFGLSCVQVTFASSIGLLNALVYGMTPEINQRVCRGCTFEDRDSARPQPGADL